MPLLFVSDYDRSHKGTAHNLCSCTVEECNKMIVLSPPFSAMADPDEGEEDVEALEEVPVPVPAPPPPGGAPPE